MENQNAVEVLSAEAKETVPYLAKTVIVLVTAVLFMGCSATAAGVTLVDNGSPAAVIVITQEAGEMEHKAARELQHHIQEMSGAKLPIENEASEDTTAILLGNAAPEGFLDELRDKTDKVHAFRLRADGKLVVIAGLESRCPMNHGTLIGVYELLEQLGVRWYMPGDIGTVIPERSDVYVLEQDVLEVPSFAGRVLSDMPEEWPARMRHGGFDAGRHGGIPIPEGPEGRMLNGRGQVRLSHPETLELTVDMVRERLEEQDVITTHGGRIAEHDGVRYISMGPFDGFGYGECPWDADDMDPLQGKLSVTDRYIKFFNKVLEAVEDDHPDAGIAFYCYSTHMRAPVREEPHPNILPVLAPIDVCRFHSVDCEHCWERQYIADVIEEWEKLGTRMMYRGYIFNLADPSLPFSMIRQTATELPYFHERGMLASRIEAKPAWAYHGPSLYLASRLMWDVDLDPDEVMQDFFDGMYGPASAPMLEHFEIIEDAFQDADYHTGNVLDFPHILTGDVLEAMENELARAERMVEEGSPEAERIDMVRLAFDYGKTHLAMMNAIYEFDFAQANDLLDSLYEEFVPAATEHEPPILNTRYVPGFIDRFWRDIVRQGYERTVGGNEIIATLPDRWLAMADPHDGGEELGLWKPNIGTGSWMELNTFSESWSNQGLRYYKGDNAIMWYRTSVEIPENIDPSDHIFLWLGSVDNRAEVWINGHSLETLRRGAAPFGRPWEYLAADVLEPGRENVIVIKAVNDLHRELGTGGLTMPAMLWRAEEVDMDRMRDEEGTDPLDFLPGQ